MPDRDGKSDWRRTCNLAETLSPRLEQIRVPARALEVTVTITATARRAALGVLLASGAFVGDALADPIIDPIVRVREGGESIPITSVPFTYDFGLFPGDPDGAGLDCVTGTDIGTGLPMVSCAFQNRTGKTLSLLDFFFVLPPDPGTLAFFVEDPDDFFTG
jgi:hypothetical protein